MSVLSAPLLVRLIHVRQTIAYDEDRFPNFITGSDCRFFRDVSLLANTKTAGIIPPTSAQRVRQ